MKRGMFLTLAMGAAVVCEAGKIAVPQAPVVTYGLIRDEYGTPMTKASAATVELVRENDESGFVYARCAVGDSGLAGMNYRLALEIDSSGPSRRYAVVTNTQMRIKATVSGRAQALTPTSTFVCLQQGMKQRRDYSTGLDADLDGMPDDWEEWVLDASGRDSTSVGIAAFRPEDDADGDGMTNLAEYLAGTDPFLETDLLKIESFRIIPGSDLAEVKFWTIPERKYRLLMTESLADPMWTPVPTSADEKGELVYETYAGNGHLRTVFTSAELSSVFFRVAVD